MKHLKLICLFLFAAIISVENMMAATATLLVGQSYQTEINTSGYHYIGIESISSTNPSVSVTKMGLVVKATVNAYFLGEATVTTKLRYQLYAGQNYQYRNQEFTISCNETQINVSPTSTSIGVGTTIQLAYGFNRPTYATPNIQWTTSDENVATVSTDGTVTGVSVGNATIYARSDLGNNTSQCAIRVINNSDGGESVEGQDSTVPDTSWYNESETIFEISTLGQFLGFRNLVNNGTNFQSKTVKLAKDIDLTSINWDKSIGVSSDKKFMGVFDGQKHSLTIRINKVDANSQNCAYYGLFGYSGGTICNVILNGNINLEIADFTTYCYLGGVCGYSIGNIESCWNRANICYTRSYLKSTGNEDFVGGIVGYSSKLISNCINNGQISSNSKKSNANTNGYMVGGIAGKGTQRIEKCSNHGTVLNNVLSSNGVNLYEYIGGIAGLVSSITVESCSNFGNIIGHNRDSGIGGIIGNTNGNSKCLNCYVGYCQIINSEGGSASYLNAICGRIVYNNSNFSNNFSANDIYYTNKRNGESGNTTYSSDQMKTENFSSTLGNGRWLGAEGLYPVVKGSLEEYGYYVTTVTDLTSNSATLYSNVWDVLASDIKVWGFLLTLDDGKESYLPGELGKYFINVNGLSPERSYKVRWYAQDKEGKEYYGVYKTFNTKSITPTTLPNPACGVFDAVLEGKSDFDGATKRGFYVQRADQEDNGIYVWSPELDGELFKIPVYELESNTKYTFCAVVETDGIFYNGDIFQFSTKSLATKSPSEFTATKATLNGQIGIEVTSAWFEIRADSWPSVIESDIVNIADFKIGNISAQSPNLKLNESYRYRLAADNYGEVIYGDWIEFEFEGESGFEAIFFDSIDETKPIYLYNLSGQLIYEGIMSNFNLTHGIYIVRQGGKAYKKQL